jgi:hypothetical protein
MSRKLGFWLLWFSVVIYAFFFAPPNQSDTFELIKNLSIGKWDGINPLIIALFNIMGIWPLVYSCLMLIDGKEQKIPAWLFTTASFGVGAFALLPYLALRKANQTFTGSKDILLKILDSRWLGIVLFLATLILLSFGFLKGDWGDFIQQWQTNRFIHVMSLDFCLLCLLFPALLGDDMARRGLKNSSLFWPVALLPLVGPLLYLCLRPPLSEIRQEVVSVPQQSLSNSASD